MSNVSCQILSLPNCTIPISYIQPDKGVALIPWIYTVLLLIVHLPLILIKVAKWETGQLLSLALSSFAVGLTILSFHSTRLEPSQVYIWTPLTLTIDVGALLQIMALIWEDKKKKKAVKQKLKKWSIWSKKERTRTLKMEDGKGKGPGTEMEMDQLPAVDAQPTGVVYGMEDHDDAPSGSQSPPVVPTPFSAKGSKGKGVTTAVEGRRLIGAIATGEEAGPSTSAEMVPSPTDIGPADYLTPPSQFLPANTGIPPAHVRKRLSAPRPGAMDLDNDSRTQTPQPDNIPLLANHPQPDSPPSGPSLPRSATMPVDENKNAGFYIFVLASAALMCLALVILQIIGLAFAWKGYIERNNYNLLQSWCSPIFLLGTNVMDLDCVEYPVTAHFTYALGCIHLPGDYADWLVGSGLVIVVQLVFQFVDAIFLTLTHSEMRWNHGVKLHRPWTTAILGTAVYAFLITLSIIKTHDNPMPTGRTVAISMMNGTSCKAEVYAAGLRGAIIGWSDGVFHAWGMQYTGMAPD